MKGYRGLCLFMQRIRKSDYKILKVGRIIADIDHCRNVHQEHIPEAAQYRNLDRDLWK